MHTAVTGGVLNDTGSLALASGDSRRPHHAAGLPRQDLSQADSRLSQFDRVRRLLRSRFGDAVRESLSALAVCLRQSPDGSERKTRSQTGWRRRSGAALVADVSGRILKAQSEMDHLTASCLRSLPLCATQGRCVRRAVLTDDALEIIARRLAEAIVAADPQGYRLYARSINAISSRRWHLDLSNPLGALVLARALIGCITDCLVSDEQRRGLAAALMGDCVVAMRRAIDQTTIFMREIGIEPLPVAIGFSFEVFADGIDTGSNPESRPVSMKHIPATPGSAAAAANFSPAHASHAAAAWAGANHRSEQAARIVGLQSLRETAPLDGLGPEAAPAAVLAVSSVEYDAIAFAHSVGAPPCSRASRQHYFAAVRAVLSHESCSATQLAAVELVGAMFDYVIDDRALPATLRPLIWRLQRPAVTLVLLDPGYLGDHPRSLSHLLDNVGSLVGADGFDATAGSRQLRRLETVVRAVEIVSARLTGRVRVLSVQANTEYSRCAAGIAQLVNRIDRDRRTLESVSGHRNRRDFAHRPGQEQERQATERLTSLLSSKVSGQILPDSVARFLQSVWLRYMRTALLHEGEHSNRFRSAEMLVDELLWTLNAEPGVGDRRELAQRIPALIHQVNHGLREVGAQESEHQAFFDELFLIHLRKLQRLRAASARSLGAGGAGTSEPGNPTPALPVLDHSLPGPLGALSERASGRGGASVTGSSSLLKSASVGTGGEVSTASGDENLSGPSRPLGGNRLLSILQTVSLDDLPSERSYQSHAGADAMAKITCGSWLDYTHSDGRVVSLKVAWLNEARSVALLVRNPDRRALSKSMAQLRRLFADGRLRILSAAGAA